MLRYVHSNASLDIDNNVVRYQAMLLADQFHNQYDLEL